MPRAGSKSHACAPTPASPRRLPPRPPRRADAASPMAWFRRSPARKASLVTPARSVAPPPVTPGSPSTTPATSPWGRAPSRTVVLDRQPILPPRWASAGSVAQSSRRARRGARSPLGLAAALAAIAMSAMGLRTVLVPQDALAVTARHAPPAPAVAARRAPTPANALTARPAPAPAPTERPSASVPRHVLSLPDPCPLDWRSNQPRVRRLIACEADLWNVPGGAAKAFAVAHCESRFEIAAFNPTGCGGSGCSGLFQQSLRYWRRRAASYGFAGRPPTDPRANVVVSMRMAAEQGTWSRDWPVCGR